MKLKAVKKNKVGVIALGNVSDGLNSRCLAKRRKNCRCHLRKPFRYFHRSHTPVCAPTRQHLHSHANTCTLTPTRALPRQCANSHAKAHTLTPTNKLSRQQAYFHAHVRTLTPTVKHKQTHACVLLYARKHNHKLSHMHAGLHCSKGIMRQHRG